VSARQAAGTGRSRPPLPLPRPRPRQGAPGAAGTSAKVLGFCGVTVSLRNLPPAPNKTRRGGAGGSSAAVPGGDVGPAWARARAGEGAPGGRRRP
jgi:hypothetical protein